MSKIEFKIPSKDTPGFLRRSKTALGFKKKLQSDPEEEDLDRLVNFLLDYVEKPEDRTEAANALWDASENQFMDLLTAIGGGDSESEDNPPPKK